MFSYFRSMQCIKIEDKTCHHFLCKQYECPFKLYFKRLQTSLKISNYILYTNFLNLYFVEISHQRKCDNAQNSFLKICSTIHHNSAILKRILMKQFDEWNHVQVLTKLRSLCTSRRCFNLNEKKYRTVYKLHQHLYLYS